MKKFFTVNAVGCVILMLSSLGCQVSTPPDLANENAPAVVEPVPYYGDMVMFSETNTPLVVQVSNTPDTDEAALAGFANSALQQSDVKSSAPGSPCDIRVIIDSDCRRITSAPQCRLSNSITITVAAPDGTKLLPDWTHKSETLQGYSTEVKAREAMLPQLRNAVNEWQRSYFRNNAANQLKAAVLRFKTSKHLIEINPIRFEKDLRSILNALRKIDGVADVRMIEADKQNRIASFRVLYYSSKIGSKQFRNMVKLED